MDPITALLTTYLNTATGTLSKSVSDHMDLALKVESVRHQDTQVTFAHQQWRIREASVCQADQSDVTRLARCTQAARDLFIHLCNDLQATPRSHPDYPHLQQMYCTAATTYRPTQASVEWAPPVDAARQKTQACRLAQAALLGENTPELRQRRKVACQAAGHD